MNARISAGLLTAALGCLLAGAAQANDPDAQNDGRDKMTERESAQPVDDTWITTKVKADLLATRDVSGLEIDVETVNAWCP